MLSKKAIGAAYAINWAFYDIQRINGQEYLDKSTSPNGTYTVTAYLNNSGATTDYAVLGRLKNNRNGKIFIGSTTAQKLKWNG